MLPWIFLGAFLKAANPADFFHCELRLLTQTTWRPESKTFRSVETERLPGGHAFVAHLDSKNNLTLASGESELAFELVLTRGHSLVFRPVSKEPQQGSLTLSRFPSGEATLIEYQVHHIVPSNEPTMFTYFSRCRKR